MRRLAPLLLAATLLTGSGCATRPDWIESTLVNGVGTWEKGALTGATAGAVLRS